MLGSRIDQHIFTPIIEQRYTHPTLSNALDYQYVEHPIHRSSGVPADG